MIHKIHNKTYLMIVDTETGGLSSESASVIEVAAQLHVVLDTSREKPGKSYRRHFRLSAVSDPFHRLVRPRLPVEEQAAAVNGYDPDRWEREGVNYDVAMRDLHAFLVEEEPDIEGIVWAGSNVLGFDLPFLRSEMAAAGLELPGKPRFARRTLNTESLCFPLFARGLTDSCGVAALRTWVGLKGEQHHTAIGDIEDTAAIIARYFNFIDSAFQLNEGSFRPPETILSTLGTLRILDVARAAGIELKEVSPGQHLGCVPWRKDNNPSLRIYADQDTWADLGTSQNGNVADFIVRLGSLR
jgi:DNA polymerase III epsilon subunit-like protein